MGQITTILKSTLLAVCVMASGNCHAAGAGNPTELKAAYIFKFCTFTEWPAAAIKAQFFIGVLGSTADVRIVEETIGRQKVNGVPIVVRQVRSISDIAGCAVVYVTEAERERFREFQGQLAGRPILTISDGDAPGLITLRAADGVIKFNINQQAAERTGLRISAQILRLSAK